MTQLELLVGAQEFWARARGDIAAARDRVLVQAMSFEGDAAGLAVAAAIRAAGAPDRRVLVDAYTRWVISDRFFRSPLARRDVALQAEARSTEAMFDALVASGARVRVTNPVGPLFARYPARNHKKLIVADDVAYIGGINFSDHNFAWDDFMVRLEGVAAADFLAADFVATFEGRARPAALDIGDLALRCLDGRRNLDGFAGVLALIAGAARTITVISPYLTFPFTDALASAARRGVAVRLITTGASNKPTVAAYLFDAAARAGFDVRLLPGMIHLKGMLIDDADLVVGSSNFDFVSLAAEEEIVAIIREPGLIVAFRTRIIAPALARSAPPRGPPPSRVAGVAARVALEAAHAFARSAKLAPRGARDWSGGLTSSVRRSR
ncbi:MAG: phosphatidylserine/phosphatidylglycerophosphate/cardiolipin synthase family protein [Caulobacteraceae bacterium]